MGKNEVTCNTTESIPYMEIATPFAVEPDESSESGHARFLNDILMFGSLQDTSDSGEEANVPPLVEVIFRDQVLSCVPNTAFNKNLISMITLMKIGDLTKLKPQKKIVELINKLNYHS